MMLGVLAALAAAVAPDPSQSPGWKPPAWLKKPTPEEIHAAWPRKALNDGRGGKAMLDCRVNIHGVTEDCRITSESPVGEGFGVAALLMTPQLLFKPATLAGAPIPSRVQFPVNFENESGPHGAGPGTGVTMLNHPRWITAPNFADIGAAYPEAGGGEAGYVAFRCEVNRSGGLRNCQALREEPMGRGFERAAFRLIAKFRLEMDPETKAAPQPLIVNLPIRLFDPAGTEFTNRRLGEPIWLNGIDPTKVQALFPAEAANQGMKTGLGVAACTVTTDGALTDCAPAPGDPDGVGFSEAAVRVATVMKMNLWTQEGGPVDGARVKLPIRFNLADQTAPAR